VAVFGQKDYQQLQIIRQLTKDLDYDIKIVAGGIVREPDGLAMSSRNAYLTDAQRASALSLNQSLHRAGKMIEKGQKDAETIKKELKSFIHSFDETRVDYITICNPDTLEDTKILQGPVLLALAVKVGSIRLIDNAMFNQD
jgi:pantoate--beta-alanine ligase